MKDGWRSKVKNVPGQLSPVPKLEKLIGNLGIDNDTHVVIYHAGASALDAGSATRVYWTFKVLGHDNVSILDGGLAAYRADKKNKLEKGSNKPQPKAFKANLREDMLVGKAEVQKAIDANVPLVDLRPNNQFIGINRHPKAKRNGTIPGARNLPESWMTVNNGGKFRNRDRKPVKPFDTRAIAPAAGFTSTVNDLARFASWQFRTLAGEANEVLASNTLREMHRVHWVDPDWKTTWGIGFVVYEQNGTSVVGHGGGCPGYITQFVLVPKKKIALLWSQVSTRISSFDQKPASGMIPDSESAPTMNMR